jgi:methyl-accepting chemotaxis protein WspA
MTGFSQWRLSMKLAVLVVVSVAGLMTFGALVYGTLGTVKVNGPLYADIISGKDLIADVLPPPASAMESYLTVHEMEESTDAAELAGLIETSKRLRAEYEARHDHWLHALPDGSLRRAMVERSYEPALRFFGIVAGEFVPALLAGDHAKATALLRGSLKASYAEHQRAIDEVVKLATASNIADEKNAAEVVAQETWILFLVAMLVAVVNIFLAIAITRNLTRRISLGVEVARQVAGGDLSGTIQVEGNDETGALLAAIKGMTESLSSLISRVKQSSVALMSTATEISATSKEQESTVNAFSASTAEIAAAAKQISATSQELLATMTEVRTVAATSASLAESGTTGLGEMDGTMQQLSASTGSISAKLSVIREKANDINLVVTTITKVADQTNLLSVNAAIEAEKAGEYGLGFLVVAREIRRLADQSAVATLDIEQMVRLMQGAVSAGVMEMDKFTEEVRRGVKSVAQIGSQLAQIIEQVQGLSGRIDVVSEGMRSQSNGASQISQAMTQLTDGARQTAASLREFNSATGSLREAVSGLKQEISHFTVAS